MVAHTKYVAPTNAPNIVISLLAQGEMQNTHWLKERRSRCLLKPLLCICRWEEPQCTPTKSLPRSLSLSQNKNPTKKQMFCAGWWTSSVSVENFSVILLWSAPHLFIIKISLSPADLLTVCFESRLLFQAERERVLYCVHIPQTWYWHLERKKKREKHQHSSRNRWLEHKDWKHWFDLLMKLNEYHQNITQFALFHLFDFITHWL